MPKQQVYNDAKTTGVKLCQNNRCTMMPKQQVYNDAKTTGVK